MMHCYFGPANGASFRFDALSNSGSLPFLDIPNSLTTSL